MHELSGGRRIAPDDLADSLQALAGPGAGPNGGQIYIDGFSGGQRAIAFRLPKYLRATAACLTISTRAQVIAPSGSHEHLCEG
jgi:hypothetical protein